MPTELAPHDLDPDAVPVFDAEAFHVFDTTLRDGAQREGVTYSVADKLAVARLLDEIGVGFIEGGWPGALPKDTEFFARARTELQLRHAQLVAFGATRKAGVRVEDDPQVQALLDSEAPVVCVVAKSDVRHVREALRTSLEENLAMVADTVSHLVAAGRRVFVDCEHFFDGYAVDPDYGVRVLAAAFAAGAEVGVLCDTNGGMLPTGVARVVADVRSRVVGRLGIHCQDDTGCAVANSLAAVEAGVTHVQGTANGYGERAGNADTFALIGNLVTKMGLPVVPAECLPELTRVSAAIAELANIAPDDHQPYVGASAFAHKAGLHASAIKVDPQLYNHLDPAVVGNDMRILVTEMAGRASVELKGRELGVDLDGQGDAIGRVVDQVKVLEADGWSFEAADASFELLLRAQLPGAPEPLFELESYRTSVEHWGNGVVVSEATVKVHVRTASGERERVISTAEGNGPVNALDNALRQALVGQFPALAGVSLADYKVRILGWNGGTSATTRVLIDSTDGAGEWTTVGVHDNIVEASWHALVDALTYAVRHRPGAPAAVHPASGSA
ncbi:citramalate synthase [Modestobacter sp. SYSU DS0657]